MTYFEFLLLFVAVPILLVWLGSGRGPWQDKATWAAIGIQVLLAVLYTTPWDNHLVASHVWHYDPKLVAGIVLGYVPLEEYVFFVLETLLVGLSWQRLRRPAVATRQFESAPGARRGAVVAATALWLASVLVLLSGWRNGTYLALILAWALPPLMIQLAYGADILWHERGLITSVALPLILYLSAADAVAIRAGIWTIDAEQSTGLFIANLPAEEAAFFFVTVVLITFGLTLTLSEESHTRFAALKRSISRRIQRVVAVVRR